MAERRDPDSPPPPNRPLAGLAALRGKLPPGPAPRDTDPLEPAAAGADGLGGKLLVRREVKGRAGKTVTRIEGIELAPAELESLAAELKRALGCGASLEGGAILLQGAQGPRAVEWLERRGARRVTLGN